MYSVKSSAEFISDIRGLSEELKDIRISSVEVDRDKNSVTYNFICDKSVSDALRQKIAEKAAENTAPIFSAVSVNVKKIVADEKLINAEIFRFLQENYMSVSIFLKAEDVSSVVSDDLVRYKLRLTKDGETYVLNNGAIAKLNEYLSKKFCAEFAGATEIKPEVLSINLLSDEVFESELQRIEYRTIKVENVVPIDDEFMGDLAVYIEDVRDGEVTVCGTITDMEEKETKNGKPFLVLRLDDTTGRIGGVYFSKAKTYPKIKRLQIGDAVIVRGNFGEYNGRKSLTIDKINRCDFPKNFVKKPRYKNPVPKNYRLIFPEPATGVSFKSVFDLNTELPKELTEKVYVVFDLETTGIEVSENGITEIGAVKIVGGRITEQFTTLVKPEYPITAENTALTGITPEMVAESPKIEDVIPDFIKFTEGATLVAHNASFDVGYIKRYAGLSDYEIMNPVKDTMEMAKILLPDLKRHDLKTLADRFGIEFRHHRALSDAYATAEAFIALMKIRGTRAEEKIS